MKRGYALLVVLVGIVLLSALGTSLLTMSARDRSEANVQRDTTKAVYAAEGSVAWGTEKLRELLRTNPSPTAADLAAIEPPVMQGVEFPRAEYRVEFVDPANNYTPAATASTELKALDSGVFQGLNAQQTPIQVLSTARVHLASATIADILRMELIPVFQFAVFMDQPIEYFLPETSTVSGRMHSNQGVYFGDGADDVSILDGNITTAGRVWLRAIGQLSSSVSGRAPTVNGTTLACDDAESDPLACPNGASWSEWTAASLPEVRDQAHGVAAIHLPTGTDTESFGRRVTSVPDVCGQEPDGDLVMTAGLGMPLSADWQLVDLPRTNDTSSLKATKLAHKASVRVVDGVWEKRSGASWSPWFRQDDPSTPEARCVYWGYDPTGSDPGDPISSSDGVPAIRDARFWDFQDRRMRRVLMVDVHRLTRCLPFLDTADFDGVLYFGESTDARVDNWGLDPDAAFYAVDGSGACADELLNLPHYLRGQVSSRVSALPSPSYLANDDVAGAPVLDNPYYPSASFCAPNTTGRTKALGDGPHRLPQGDGDGTLEPGRNELVENGVLLRNAARLPDFTNGVKHRGFTFATNLPVYLQGDVNVKVGAFDVDADTYVPGKVPASVVGDAVTFLSEKYNELQENPFAPVGPLAAWQAIGDTGANVFDAQVDDGGAGGRRWSMLALAQPGATATGAARFDADRSPANVPPPAFRPSSPAPCVNLLRELALRRRLTDGGASLAGPFTGDRCGDGTTDDCGLAGLTHVQASGIPLAYDVDWLKDLSTTPQALRASASAGAPSLYVDGDVEDWTRLMNAFVAFAPLERFLDVSMYQVVDPSDPRFASRDALPTGRDDREALRDWMRCTLNSGHDLADDGSLASIRYAGALAPAVRMGAQPQPARGADAQDGMLAGGGGASFDVTYLSILGHDGFAPMSTDAVFRRSGAALFTRDRSSLVDANGSSSPLEIAQDLTNLAAAAAGDQLALNLSILAGSSWRCPKGLPFPARPSSKPLNDSLTSLAGQGGMWFATGIDEGVYGMFRYQESWWQMPRTGAERYVDFFVNGSVVAMFYSREANGRHILNQGFLPNTLSGGGCGGQDNGQEASRTCRLSPGFEYAWESSRRSIRYDQANDTADGLPPGVPMVVNSTRLRWMRR